MKCPFCTTDTLQPMVVGGSSLDFCSGCGGTWFDLKELDIFLGVQVEWSAEEDATVAPARTKQDSPYRAASDVRRCPRCHDSVLVPVCMMSPGDIWLDRCPRCRGCFVERGEAPKLRYKSG